MKKIIFAITFFYLFLQSLFGPSFIPVFNFKTVYATCEFDFPTDDSCGCSTPTPTPSSCQTPTPTPTTSPCLTPTVTPTPTQNLTPTVTPTQTLTPTPTQIQTPTPTPTQTPDIEIKLSKINDKPNGASAGNIVTFTLTVTNTPENLNSMMVIDNLPERFVYQTGSAVVNGGTVSSNEPTITNNGKTLTWTWSKVNSSEIVTISYKAKINDNAQPATYTNIAFAKGSSESNKIKSNIVQSEIKIGPFFDYSSTVGKDQVLGIGGGDILGAVLPEAGSDTNIVLLALCLIGIGIFLEIKTRKSNKKS